MIRTDSAKCLRCSGCVGVCPRSALTLTEHGISCDSRCNDCKICMNFCPMGAISLTEGVAEERRRPLTPSSQTRLPARVAGDAK